MKNCYEVRCKGGHVGKDFYYPMFLYIEAESGKEAAWIARYTPRVKHDHKDCVLGVQKISHEELLDGRRRNHEDGYYRSHSKQDFLSRCPDYQERLIPETHGRLDEYEGTKVPLSFQNRKKYHRYTVRPPKDVWWEDMYTMEESE